MHIIDSETRKEGVNYKAVGAQEEGEEEFLYFAQPIDSMLKAHKAHDKNLNALLDVEMDEDEDAIYRETSLEPLYDE